MIRPYDALLRQAREFFAGNLVGKYRWDHVKVSPPEENPEVDGRRMMFSDNKVPADSRHREMVRLVFGDFELILETSNERPPMGLISLRRGINEAVVNGPLDAETWRRVACEILKPAKEMSYGNG